jgi:hypothetical protein
MCVYKEKKLMILIILEEKIDFWIYALMIVGENQFGKKNIFIVCKPQNPFELYAYIQIKIVLKHNS